MYFALQNHTSRKLKRKLTWIGYCFEVSTNYLYLLWQSGLIGGMGILPV